MAIASTPTKLPLARWAKILGMHPLHFEQVAYTKPGRSTPICDAAIVQYDWQDADRVSREQIAMAVSMAEQTLERELGFSVAPCWEANEWHQVTQHYRVSNRIGSWGGNPFGFRQSVQADKSYVITGGTERKTLLQTTLPITWSDADSDGYPETGTVVAVVPVGTPACEVEVYYPGQNGAAQYQIRPASAVVIGAVATITFRRELCVKLELLESLDPRPAVAVTDSDFESEVDVYRHWNDPSAQVQLLWEPQGGCVACGDVGCASCAYVVQDGCLYLRTTGKNAVLGWSAATWDTDNDVFQPASLSLAKKPDLVRLWYYAGWQPTTGCRQVMDDRWARAVTYLSLQYLDRPACDCQASTYDYWRQDFALVQGEETGVQYNAGYMGNLLQNPFGTKRGAIYAWQRVIEPDVQRVNSASLV